ncbi:MAG: GntR family transcriptional regulator [Anaerolineaceae bacterium]|nr:GntR family transcriptional regulator [Anaerolineaceae bacterium]
MRIPLDRHSEIPLYEQVQDYLRTHIVAGQLAPETRLPATRKLAKELGVSRITIQNAYANLESEGLIANREGSGAYVLPPVQMQTAVTDSSSHQWPLWQQALSDTTAKQLTTSLPSHPDTISFTGVGDPRHFPLKDFQKSLNAVLKNEGSAVLEYGEMGAGYGPLRETVAHILASQGIQTYAQNVLITTGSQQALALICQVLLKPGDVVLVEKPTYNFALNLFRTLGLEIVGVPIDEDGLIVEQLEPLLQQHHPKLLYTIPNFQNPSGVCLAGARRRQLIALAERYNLPILEDDFVGDLRYNGRSQPAIKALDPMGQVIYVGTFSKMLMPGLRLGYVVADGPLFGRLVQLKQVTDLNSSPLIQHVVNDYISVGRYQSHLRRSIRRYRQRRDAMLDAIKQYLPPEVTVIPPQGGLFVWLRLPPLLSALALRPLAAQAGVAYAPGSWFFPEPEEGEPYVRLNFAVQTPDRIAEGIRRLGRVAEEAAVN